MILKITIGGVDRTNLINFSTFRREDILTSQVDTCKFKYLKYSGMTWQPAREDTVLIEDTDAGTVLFGGRIIDVNIVLLKDGDLEYTCICKDYTTDLDSDLIAQSYTSQTIQQIIDDIKPAGFTSTNVSGAITVDKITFNYQQVSECLKDLAELVNYDWYVDHAKDIHFFAKSEKSAPFVVTDTSANVIGGTLQINMSNSQLKNLVFVRGGNYVGNSRVESYDADGEQKTFPLGNKYSEKPTATKDTGGGPVALAIGIDFLQDFTDGPFDCLWDFNQKYLRFDVAPNAGDIIAITGTPLVPLIVQIDDAASIATYGKKESKIEDRNLTNADTARERGAAELEAYKDGITEGKFLTYTDGLRSGQTIRVNSTIFNVDELFLIRKVKMRMHTQAQAVYEITLVSYRTMGIVEFLQKIIRDQNKKLETRENEVLTIAKTVIAEINIAEEIDEETQRQVFETIDIAESVRQDPWGQGVISWVFGEYFPADDADSKRHGRFDRFTVA